MLILEFIGALTVAAVVVYFVLRLVAWVCDW